MCWSVFLLNLQAEILKNSQENACRSVFDNIELIIKKKSSDQLVCFEFCESFENTLSEEHLWTTASEQTLFTFTDIKS